MKICDYVLVAGKDCELEKRIRVKLGEGWILFGQPFTTGRELSPPPRSDSSMGMAEFAQAMIREDDSSASKPIGGNFIAGADIKMGQHLEIDRRTGMIIPAQD